MEEEIKELARSRAFKGLVAYLGKHRLTRLQDQCLTLDPVSDAVALARAQGQAGEIRFFLGELAAEAAEWWKEREEGDDRV